MSNTEINNDEAWLYPEFRSRLRMAMNEVQELTGEVWVIVEGYRSVARQLWLYAQGRTRPGPVVTWKRTPTWHGVGLAADVRPRRGYQVPTDYWVKLRECGRRYGLNNPAWEKGDLGHLQLSSPTVRADAVHWFEQGRPAKIEIPTKAPEVRVNVMGAVVEDVDAHLVNDHVRLRLRPVMQALNGDVVSFDKVNGRAVVVRESDEPGVEGRTATVTAELEARGDRYFAYTWAKELADVFGLKLVYYQKTKGLVIKE